MLPKPTEPGFPEALKAAREAKNWSFKDLAQAVGISDVMPSRYENRNHSSFGPPSDKTWKKLNAALFGTEVASSGATNSEGLLLKNASIEDIVKELKVRGAKTVKIDFNFA